MNLLVDVIYWHVFILLWWSFYFQDNDEFINLVITFDLVDEDVLKQSREILPTQCLNWPYLKPYPVVESWCKSLVESIRWTGGKEMVSHIYIAKMFWRYKNWEVQFSWFWTFSPSSCIMAESSLISSLLFSQHISELSLWNRPWLENTNEADLLWCCQVNWSLVVPL